LNENFIDSNFEAQKKPLWIGLKKKSNTNVWEWADSTIASGVSAANVLNFLNPV